MSETYKFAEHTIQRRLADQIVFLQTNSSEYFVTSGPGLLICEQIDKGFSLERVVSNICDTFDVDTETATTDTESFLRSLESAGIIFKTCK